MSKKSLSRRRFLAGTGAMGAGLLMSHPRAFGANERIRIGVIGCGSRGKGNVRWSEENGASVVAVCDPDAKQAAGAVKRAKDADRVKQYKDLRHLLDDSSIDAVIVTTPNHWHALATVWACQAGKDVYVEKPASHSIWEGRKMVEAARKYKRIVQVGCQQRSDPAYLTLKAKLDAKELGEVQWIHSLWYTYRKPIGKVSGPQPIKDKEAYNLWCGPRPVVPLMRRRFHYHWHWVWDYGNGDMGNRVIHLIDDIHHVMRMNDNYPTRAMAVGGRFRYDDDANAPNTELIIMDWKVPILFDCRNLPAVDPTTGEIKGSDIYRRFGHQTSCDNLIKCEGGFYAVRRSSGEVYDNAGKCIEKIAGDGGAAHMGNWLEAIRSRDVSHLRADIEQGHFSSAILHIGNNSYRVGKPADASQVADAIGNGEEQAETWRQTLEHLRCNGVDFAREPATLGPSLTFDRNSERFVGEQADAANALVKDTYREPFVIPDEV